MTTIDKTTEQRDLGKMIEDTSSQAYIVNQVKGELQLGYNKFYKINSVGNNGNSWSSTYDFDFTGSTDGERDGLLSRMEMLWTVGQTTGTGGTFVASMDFQGLFMIDYLQLQFNGGAIYTVYGRDLYTRYVIHKNKLDYQISGKNLAGNMSKADRISYCGNVSGQTMALDLAMAYQMFKDFFDIGNLKGKMRLTVKFRDSPVPLFETDHTSLSYGAIGTPYIIATYKFSKFDKGIKMLKQLNMTRGITYGCFETIAFDYFGTTGTSATISLQQFANRKLSAVNWFCYAKATGMYEVTGASTARTTFVKMTNMSITNQSQIISGFQWQVTDEEWRKAICSHVYGTDGANTLLVGTNSGTSVWPDNTQTAFTPNVYFFSFTNDVDDTDSNATFGNVGYLDFANYPNAQLEVNFVSTSDPVFRVEGIALRKYRHKGGMCEVEKA